MPKSRKAITLWNFLHGAINEKVVVDLKDESVIEGVIEAADPSLNLHLSEATFYRRRIEGVKPEKLTHTRIQGKHIRFIHFRTYDRVLHILQRSYRKKTQ